MADKILHIRFFFMALRTGLMFIAGFISYELLKILELEWNLNHPNDNLKHSAYSKIYHFIIIFTFDLLILYLIALLFNVHL